MAWCCSGNSNGELVERLEAAGIVNDPRVKAAMLATDRGHFCPADGPRKKNSTYQYGPYADAPQAIGHKVTISAPHIHATCLEALADHAAGPGSRVLDVGSSSASSKRPVCRSPITSGGTAPPSRPGPSRTRPRPAS